MREPERKTKAAYPVLAVFALVVAGALVAAELLYSGNLYVKVDAAAGKAPQPTCTVCVYEGDVADLLDANGSSRLPQAVAAVSVPVGEEVEVDGTGKGTFTLVVLRESGSVDKRAASAVAKVGKGDTHVSFVL